MAVQQLSNIADLIDRISRTHDKTYANILNVARRLTHQQTHQQTPIYNTPNIEILYAFINGVHNRLETIRNNIQDESYVVIQ